MPPAARTAPPHCPVTMAVAFEVDIIYDAVGNVHNFHKCDPDYLFVAKRDLDGGVGGHGGHGGGLDGGYGVGDLDGG